MYLNNDSAYFVFVFSAITFQVFSMNRYKLSKKYRALVDKHGINPEDEDLKKEIQAAKVAVSIGAFPITYFIGLIILNGLIG